MRHQFLKGIFLRLTCCVFLLTPGISLAANAINIQTLEAKDTAKIIEEMKAKHTPVLMFLYASWCSVCRENMPYVLKMARQYGPRLNVLAISMDTNPVAMQRYLSTYGEVPFTPYRMKEAGSPVVTKALNALNIKYHNGVPYTVVYNHNGKIVGQGGILISSIIDPIAKLVNTADAERGKTQ